MYKWSKILTLSLLSISIYGFSSLTSASANIKVDAPRATKVKTFKVAVVRDNYNVYKGMYQHKQSLKPHLHHTFLVQQVSKMNGYTYYWLKTTDKRHTIGYVNKQAVATPNQSKLIKVPYVSQYKPVFTPWGCAGASMTALLRFQGKKVNLSYVQKHLPMVPTKGGQKGNVYTGAGFGYVIRPGALTKYAHHWDKNVINISSKKLTVNAIKQYVQGGKPVLYYGFSSYQKHDDYKRNHCKVITGYRNHKFRVADPLYYSKHAKAGTGGKNMKYDRGAIAWVSESAIRAEYTHWALTVK